MLAVPAGRDIPAAGEGGGKKKRPRGFLPAAPGGSCRTDVATAGGDTPHPVPSRTARALGNADPGGADVPTAGPTPPPRSWRQSFPPRADVPQVVAAAPEPGVVVGAPRPGAGWQRGWTHRATGKEGSRPQWGRGWRRQEQQLKPGWAFPPMAGLQRPAGNRSGSLSTKPALIEAGQGCKRSKGN